MKHILIILIVFLSVQNLFSQNVADVPFVKETSSMFDKYKFVMVDVTKNNLYIDNAYFIIDKKDDGLIGLCVPSNDVPMYMILLIYINELPDEYIENVKIFNLRDTNSIKAFGMELKKYTYDLGWPFEKIVQR